MEITTKYDERYLEITFKFGHTKMETGLLRSDGAKEYRSVLMELIKEIDLFLEQSIYQDNNNE